MGEELNVPTTIVTPEGDRFTLLEAPPPVKNKKRQKSIFSKTPVFFTKNVISLKNCWSERSQKLHAGAQDSFEKWNSNKTGCFKITSFEKKNKVFRSTPPV